MTKKILFSSFKTIFNVEADKPDDSLISLDFCARPGNKCNKRPWKIFPSNSLSALILCSGIINVTKPNPVALLVFLSTGKLISDNGPYFLKRS